MFNPKKNHCFDKDRVKAKDKVKFGAYLPEDFVKKFADYCNDKGLVMETLIDKVLEEFLDKYEYKPKE